MGSRGRYLPLVDMTASSVSQTNCHFEEREISGVICVDIDKRMLLEIQNYCLKVNMTDFRKNTIIYWVLKCTDLRKILIT